MDKIKLVKSDGFDYIYYDEEFWFTQRNMANILGIKSHTINWHLKEIEKVKIDFKASQFKIEQMEGARLISRMTNHYSLESLFDISMRCNNLDRFNKAKNEINKKFKVSLDFKVRPLKEQNFKVILDRALKGILNFEYQYSVGKYFVDFYFPELNLCVEYDENHHRNTTGKDIIREKNIKKHLQCNFLRVTEGNELEGLNKLIKLKLLI